MPRGQLISKKKTGWLDPPYGLPAELEAQAAELDEDGRFIICKTCQRYHQLQGTQKDGKVAGKVALQSPFGYWPFTQHIGGQTHGERREWLEIHDQRSQDRTHAPAGKDTISPPDHHQEASKQTIIPIDLCYGLLKKRDRNDQALQQCLENYAVYYTGISEKNEIPPTVVRQVESRTEGTFFSLFAPDCCGSGFNVDFREGFRCCDTCRNVFDDNGEHYLKNQRRKFRDKMKIVHSVRQLKEDAGSTTPTNLSPEAIKQIDKICKTQVPCFSDTGKELREWCLRVRRTVSTPLSMPAHQGEGVGSIGLVGVEVGSPAKSAGDGNASATKSGSENHRSVTGKRPATERGEASVAPVHTPDSKKRLRDTANPSALERMKDAESIRCFLTDEEYVMKRNEIVDSVLWDKSKSVYDRMAEFEQLREVLTDEEFTAKRKEFISAV